MSAHTHLQHYSVTSSTTNPDKFIAMNQIGPSVTTGTLQNPAYALIDVDAETMLPTNWRIFAMDMDKTNANDKAEYYQMIDYTKDYGLTPGLSPQSLYDLAKRFEQDQDLLWQFAWDEHRQVHDKFIGDVTDFESMSQDHFCMFTAAYDHEYDSCKGQKYANPMDTIIGKWKVQANNI